VAVKLSMTTNNWNPASALSYITLSWNSENYMLSGGSVVQAALTLSVSSTISGIANFSFDIIITGTEHP
jgi:DeoR/GlpR family transcriptional regulator of sugar metabolism